MFISRGIVKNLNVLAIGQAVKFVSVQQRYWLVASVSVNPV